MYERAFPDITLACQALLHDGTRNLIAAEGPPSSMNRFQLGSEQLELYEALRSGRKVIVDKENAPQTK